MYKTTLLFFLLFTATLYSQKHLDIATAEVSVTEKSSYINPHILLPIVVDSNNTILFNLGFKQSTFEDQFTKKNNTYLQYLTSIGWRHSMKNNWSVTSLVFNRLRNKTGGIKTSIKDRYQIGGAIILEKEKSNSLTYKGGVYLNNDAFGALFVPMLGLDWRINEHLQLKTLFPLNALIYYHFNKKSSLSLRFKGVIESYEWINTNNAELYTQVSYNEFTLAYEMEPIKSLVIQAKAGLLAGTQNKDYYKGDNVPLTVSAIRFGENRTPLSKSPYNGWIIGLSFIYRVHL